MQAFDFINDMVQWCAQFVPAWELLEPTHAGVKFKSGGRTEILKPGYVYWWWPAVTKVYVMNTRRQTLMFSQRLTTKDMVEVQLNTVIVFEIDDAEKALTVVRDFEDTIGEIAQKLTIKPIMSRTLEEIQRDMAETSNVRNEITRGAKRNLPEFGMLVLDAYVCDLTKTKVFSHVGGGFALEEEDEDE